MSFSNNRPPNSYLVEVPVPNHAHDTARSLSGYIDLLEKYKDRIECLYFPLGHVEPGLDVWGIRAPNYVYLNDGSINLAGVAAWENALLEINSYQGLPIRLLMNDTFNPAFNNVAQLESIRRKVSYYAKHFKILSITIADFSLIPHVVGWGHKVSLSTNSHNSFAELDMALELYGPSVFESVVLQRDLNRNPVKFHSYARKRGIEDKFILMVNEGCVNACPFKASGDVEISVSDVHSKANKIHTVGCSMLAQPDRAWSFLTSPFLTYAMLQEYYPEVRTIKLAGRNLPVSALKKQLDHWINGTSYELHEILNVSAGPGSKVTTSDLDAQYVRNVMTCNKECYVCNKCKETNASLFSKHPSIALMLQQTQILKGPVV